MIPGLHGSALQRWQAHRHRECYQRRRMRRNPRTVHGHMITFTGFFFLVFAVIGMHRVYNFEAIFEWWREFMKRRGSWATPLRCAACNAFWIAAACTALLYFQPIYGALLLTPFALYPWVRAALWSYQTNFSFIPTQQGSTKNASEIAEIYSIPQSVIPHPVSTLPTGPVPIQPPSEALRIQHERYRAYDKRIVLMTTFNDWKASYSLVSVVLDQARMLALNDRWFVQIWVNSTCTLDGVPTDLPSNVEIRKILPPISLANDVLDIKARDIICSQIIPALLILGNATVITHDIMFLASHVTFAAAIHDNIGKIQAFTWFHFCHSAPSAERPTHAGALPRTTLPPKHRLFCLSESQAPALADYYSVPRERVLVLPNARDLRVLFDAPARLVDFIRDSHLLDADIVQIFPLSTPRAQSKGLLHVIRIFAEMEKTRTVRLVVVNAHANNNSLAIGELRDEAAQAGLSKEALIFTSEAFPADAVYGLSLQDTQRLFQTGNVFIFPTESEACSLTLMEAALSGALLVLNRSVPSLLDIIPKEYCLTYEWGNLFERPMLPNPAEVAQRILRDLDTNRMNLSKRAVLRAHNLDALGAKFRAQLIAD